MLSTDDTTLDTGNITGVITNKRQNASIALAAKHNCRGASEIYSAINKKLGLNQAQNEFLQDENNIN